MKSFKLNLNIIFIGNEKGYTVYFLEYPEIIAEGDNKEDAVKNLFGTFHDVLENKSIKLNLKNNGNGIKIS